MTDSQKLEILLGIIRNRRTDEILLQDKNYNRDSFITAIRLEWVLTEFDKKTNSEEYFKALDESWVALGKGA